MTRDEFIQHYIAGSGMSREEFDQDLIAEPCECGEPDCKGWQADTKAHKDFIARLGANRPEKKGKEGADGGRSDAENT